MPLYFVDNKYLIYIIQNRASFLDFLLFSLATLPNDSRCLRAEFGPIHRPKIATFEDRAASKCIESA